MLNEKQEGLANYIARLEKLKDLYIGLYVGTNNKIHPGEVKSVAFLTKTNLLTSS